MFVVARDSLTAPAARWTITLYEKRSRVKKWKMAAPPGLLSHKCQDPHISYLANSRVKKPGILLTISVCTICAKARSKQRDGADNRGGIQCDGWKLRNTTCIRAIKMHAERFRMVAACINALSHRWRASHMASRATRSATGSCADFCPYHLPTAIRQ